MNKFFINKKLKIGILNFLFWLIIFSFFIFLQSPQVLPDPDGFYHARMSQILSTGKIQQNFPYLQFTTLNSGYVDHHFLYHIFLIPFVKIFNPLQGIKIAQAFITSIFIYLFYWFLKKEKIKYSLFWTLILVLNSPFIFRTLLIKANSLSLIFLFSGLYFIFHKKYLWLFIFSYFYVLAYGGWPLLMVLTFVYIFTDWLVKKIKSRWAWQRVLHKLNFLNLFNKKKQENGKLFFSCISGLALGVFLNPYFPQNIYFYYQQIIQIGIINYQNKINVGGEWTAYHFGELVSSSGIVFAVFLIALSLFIVSFKKQNIKSIALFLITLLFLSATLKSRRYVEYLIPFLLAFSAFSITFSLKSRDISNIYFLLKRFLIQRKIILFSSIIFLSFFSTILILKDIYKTIEDLSYGSNFNLYKNSAEYIKKNSLMGDIVFHADWDDFPALFYHNSHNYYLVGLDPTFMYNYNRALYNEWADITMGKDRIDLHNKIKKDFKTSFVFLDINHLNFNDNLIADDGFEQVYKDKEVIIYKVK